MRRPVIRASVSLENRCRAYDKDLESYMSRAFSLRSKLLALSGIPLLCALGLGTYLTLERINALNEFLAFRDAMTLADSLSELMEADNAEVTNSWCYGPTAVHDNNVEIVEKARETVAQNARDTDSAYARVKAVEARITAGKYDPGLAGILSRVDRAYKRLPGIREQMRNGLGYQIVTLAHNELTNGIQAIYPALLKETTDKELTQKLTAYSIYLDYHASCVQYISTMIWGHQIDVLPPDAYARYESYYRQSETLLKHFRNLAPPAISARVTLFCRTSVAVGWMPASGAFSRQITGTSSYTTRPSRMSSRARAKDVTVILPELCRSFDATSWTIRRPGSRISPSSGMSPLESC